MYPEIKIYIWILGCFYNVTSFKDDSGRFPKISPAACLSKCEAYDYFTLEVFIIFAYDYSNLSASDFIVS